MKSLILIAIHDLGQNPENYKFPWCAAWLQKILKQAGIPHQATLMARSFLEVGTQTSNPTLGDIVVLWRVSKDSPFGHCGLFITADSANVWILGGNQNNEVNITRYPLYQVLGYRTFYA